MTKWLSPYIWPARQNGYESQHSYLTWKELNPLTMIEWPTLTSDMEGTKSSHHERMAPSPILSYLVTDQVPPFSWRMAVAIISDLVGNKSYTLARMACTHIWHGRNWILSPWQNGPQSQIELPSNRPGASTLSESSSFLYIWPTHQNGQHSYLTWEEPNPLSITEWLSPYIWPACQNGSLSPRLSVLAN